MKRLVTKYISLILVFAATITTAYGQPLFKNSVVSNDIDFITDEDLSAKYETVLLGREKKEMPDKLSEKLFMDGVYVFRIDYEDNATVEIWCDADFSSSDAAANYVKKAANRLGKLPAALRRILHHIVIHQADEVAFAEEEGRFFVLYSGNMDKRISEHDLEETIFHETIHATLEAEHATAPAWLKAQKSDPGFITEYAAKLPEKEDLPESALFAYTLIYHPDRLPREIEEAIPRLMPNRLAYLRDLFKALEKP